MVFLIYKKRNIKEKCSEKVNGRIIRYSSVLYNNISLPVVEYGVDGKKYEVVGPKFKKVVVISYSN